MKKTKKIISLIMLLCIITNINIVASAQEESTDVEVNSFSEDNAPAFKESDPYVDGIYNTGARSAMTGLVRLYKSGSKVCALYSTVYTSKVDQIGVKDIKLQYKGSLGVWHTIVSINNRYSTNDSSYQGSFSCTGVLGRTYRLKATHYIIDGIGSESKNNETGGLTF